MKDIKGGYLSQMSGHSKWSTIKRQKAAVDAKRGRAFSKLSKEVTVAARLGGQDTDSNYRLRLAVQKARAANMPGENIERSIKRGIGEDKDAPEMLELSYEGYGPGGIALFIDVLTDNRNRTVAQIRNVLDNSGGHMSDSGSVAWMFERRGEIVVKANGNDPNEIFMVAAESGADDAEIDDSIVYVWTKPERLDEVRTNLVSNGLAVEQADLGRIASSPIDAEERGALQVLRLVSSLEELDDVRQVDTNLNITEELVATYAAA